MDSPDYKKLLSGSEKVIQKVSEKPIYFSVFVLASLIISLSIITKYDSYILFGFMTMFYSVVAISVRLFYKDLRGYRYQQKPPVWFNTLYHIFQLLFIGLWIYFALFKMVF